MKRSKKSKKTVDPGCPFIQVNNNDVLRKVMKYLPANDVVTLGSTCEKMRALSNSESVWFHLLKRDYGVEKDLVFDRNTSNKEVYKQEMEFKHLRKKTLNLEKDLRKIFISSCSNGKIEYVKCCIRRGVNIDQVKYYGETALMFASRDGHTPVVELLLNKGAKIDQVNDDGRWTALMFASLNGHTSVVELLLNKGANINQADNFGRTALMFASWYGHTEVVELLKNYIAVDKKSSSINYF